MLENEEGIQKLKEFLNKKGLKGEEIEIEKIAQNLYELGLFLVQLKVKQHSALSKLKDVEQIKIEPP